MPNSQLLRAGSSRLLIIDMQEKLVAAMTDAQRVINNCLKLVKAAELFQVPCDATEQYPQGLGPTVAPLADRLPSRPEKLRFSCVDALPWTACSRSPEAPHQVVLAGIEAHVCVLQTALDLLGLGFDVYVVADAVTSRQPLDEALALRRLADAGVEIVTTEMVLFEWCEHAGTDTFKALSRIVTGRDT